MMGWSAYQSLRHRHEVRVLTSESGRGSIREAARKGLAEESDFIFVRERWRNINYPAVDKLTSWFNNFDFQSELKETARLVLQEFRPEIIHQVTIGTWRAGNPLAGCGIPFVWGPIGGGEEIPHAFLRGFSIYSRLFEILRRASGWWARHNAEVLRTARQADWIFAGNRPTASLVRGLRGHSSNLEILPFAAFAEEKMREFAPRLCFENPGIPHIQIFSGGYVEARKGIGLALHVLAKLKRRGLKFQYEHGGIGPEQAHLMRQIKKEDLTDCAKIVAPYAGVAYREKLRTTDIFLFPSLRENCGISLLEAMGHGCVPVVADLAGPGEIVTPECGIKIPVTRPAEFEDRLTEELAKLFRDAERRRRLGEAARVRVLQNFSRNRWLEKVEAAYEAAVSK